MLFIVKILSYALNWLPKSVLMFLGDFIGTGWFFVVRIRRQTVLDNLSRAFPEFTEKQIRTLAWKNYRHYGRSFLEMMCAFSWDLDDYQKNVEITGVEAVKEHLNKGGKGGIFLHMHLGNWELASGKARACGVPLDAVVKKAKSPTVQRLLDYYRSALGMGIYFEEGTARHILRSLGKGRMVVFVLDQFMGPPIGLPVKFFGQKAGTAAALALITEKHDVPIFPAYTYRNDQNKVRLVFDPPIKYPELSEDSKDRLYEKTQFYNDVIEQCVRKYPEQWLWLHRRWKPYRGDPRWIPKKLAYVSMLLLLSLGLGGCAANKPSHTGILLPPEPKVAIPDFKKVDTVKVSELNPVGNVVKEKKKKKRVSKAKKKEEPKPVRVFAFEDLPFEMGERLQMRLRWMMLPAGTAYLEADYGPMIGGRPTLKLTGRALSSRIVDAIYHVDNRVESLVDREALIPYRFLLSMFETHQKKETRVKFDHVRKVAHYQADRKSQKWGDKKDDRKDTINLFSQDMFSAVYYARTLQFKMGRTEKFHIYENGKNFEVGLTPVKNELVTTGVGAFQCWKLKLSLKLNNVLRPTGDVFLWLSDDHKKYIVKFDAKIKIGSLNGILTEIRERK